MKQIFSNSQLKQLFFLAIILGLSYMIGNELVNFIPSFLGALTLYILTRKLYLRLTNKKVKSWVASLIVLIGFLLMILIPFSFFGEIVYSKAVKINMYSDKINQSIIFLSNYIKTEFGTDLLDKDLLKSISVFVAQNLQSFLNSSLNIVTTLFFSFFICHFMLINSVWLEEQLYNWIPLNTKNTEKVHEDFYKMVVSNAIGIPVVALAQAIVALIGYWIIGLNDMWFWFMVTFFTAAIPIVGAALAYIPIAIVFFANGQNYEGIFVLIWGVIIVSSVDNIFRFTLLKKLDDIHPLITVFGIIVGLNLFGFLGLIFGPLLISLLFSLITIYKEEYTD